MRKMCYICGEYFKQGELVEITVIAPWHEIKSTVAYSIGQPIDTYPDTLRHNKCSEGDNDYKV